MTMKLIAIYETPEDATAFDEHYRAVHAPLVQRVPGLASLTVTRPKKRLMGTADIYMIAEMSFPDQSTFDIGMASPENQAAGKDLANFAKGKVTLFIAKE